MKSFISMITILILLAPSSANSSSIRDTPTGTATFSQITTPSTPSSGKTRLYSKSDGKIYKIGPDGIEQAVGSGSGQGGINYLNSSTSSDNSDFEATVGNWLAYADAAGNLPVDGTGGSPTTICARTTSSPLRGNGSFLITKGASNLQGEGCSLDFSIDPADALFPQMQSISFDYSGSSFFHYGSNQVTDLSDIGIYIIDKTSGEVIQPANFILDGAGHFGASFQPNFNHSDYRIALHIESTNASAWTLEADNFSVGPGQKQVGAIVTDFQSYIPALASWGSATSVNIKWRRVGDSAEIAGSFVTGTVSGSAAEIDLPLGLSMDSTVATNQVIGLGFGDNTTVNYPFVILGTAGNTQAFIGLSTVSSTSPFTLFAANGIAVNGQLVSFNFKVKISGWSSNVQMSSDAGPPVIAASYNLSSSLSVTANTPIPYDTMLVDTTGAVSSGQFHVQVSGNYQVSAVLAGSGGGSITVYVAKNGSNFSYLSTFGASNFVSSGNIVVPAVAGDVIDLRPDSTATVSGGIVSNFSVSKIQSSATIAQDADVFARVGVAISNPVPTGIVAFQTVSKDTTGSYNTSTGLFTCPISGEYEVNSIIYASATASTEIDMECNGVGVATLFSFDAVASIHSGSATCTCLAGQTIGLDNLSTGIPTGGNNSVFKFYQATFRRVAN